MLKSEQSERIQGFLARHRGKLFAGQAIAFIVVGLLLAWVFGGAGGAPPPVAEMSAAAADVEPGPSMWTCSMHPQIRSTKPGKCPSAP